MTDSTMTEIPLDEAITRLRASLWPSDDAIAIVKCGDLRTVIEAAAMLKAAVEALEPFALKANYADHIALNPDDYVECAPFKASDYIRARDALASVKREGGV